MRAALILVVLAACGGAPAPKPMTNAPTAATSVTLRFAPPDVGTRYEELSEQAVDLMVDANGQQFSMQQRQLERKVVEVLEVSGPAVTRARITYVEVVESQKTGPSLQDDPSPLAGKTYVLTAGEPIAVEGESGPPTEEEIAAVRDAEKQFGKPDRIARVLDGRTFEEGVKVDLPADEITRVMGDDGLRATAMSLTFVRLDGTNALFDLSIQMEGDEQGNRISVDLTGTVVVDPDTGEAVEMTLSGPFAMRGAVKADGGMSMHSRRTEP